MTKTLKEKFEIIDIVLSNASNYFLVEPVHQTSVIKKFNIKVLKDNTSAIADLNGKVTDLIRNKEFGEIDHKKLEQYSKQLTFLTEEFEKKAEVICYLQQDSIKIEISMNDETVLFEFQEQDYLDPLMDYLEKTLGQKLLSTQVEK
ncbi:hypothetical protein [Fictibacillus norfolkensis]|uniref:Uncharacterized protein n=1 Tax=Fictibacillus norfolkensis TaxID=2762233 RepID=A0ABR8SRX6_9BACL|nr:hypothetical protein [Fictibacillus norfolkensis]MBD7966262.1 hypothetical protein [Fictibacillus norfolkensis]